jgi:glycosyltransferase involved in cell wall biosynthesis
MKQPLVSIIVSCYNQAHCITNTLESVVGQTYTNWECIIVDDGSKDTSAALIKEFIKDDTRFKYIFQDNQGVSVARNTGFKLASGNFVNFLDGDDTFLPNKLKEQVQVFEDNPEIAICICNHNHYYEKENKYAYYEFETLVKEPLEQLLYGWHNGVAFPIHAVLYHRSVWGVNEVPFAIDYSGRSEDWIFNIKVALKQCPYFYLNKVLCTYHHDGNNYTSNILKGASSTIRAAIFIQKQLPKKYQSDFLDHTIQKSMKRYAESKRVSYLHNSGNWKLGNFLTRPFFWLKKLLMK